MKGRVGMESTSVTVKTDDEINLLVPNVLLDLNYIQQH